jgi:transcriptional regulator with XRE-family HTH domain
MTKNKPSNLSFLSGLYTRVARQMGVHPSYVSRIARGERRSERISRAIATELAQFAHAGESVQHSTDSRIDPETRILWHRRIARRLKSNPQLTRLGAMIVDVQSWGRPSNIGRVSRTNLGKRIASDAAMIAAAVEQFQRLSAKLEKFPHVLSLVDRDGIVLYSCGTTGMIRQEGRVPGADWSKDRTGPSAAARVIAAGVPVVLMGQVEGDGGGLSARLGCPVRLSNRQVVGAVVLSMDVEHVRAERLLDISKVAKKLCQPLDKPVGKAWRSPSRSAVQPFEEAELHLARVMSLPQLDQPTRAILAALLAELEGSRREILVKGQSNKRPTGKAQARGVS